MPEYSADGSMPYVIEISLVTTLYQPDLNTRRIERKCGFIVHAAAHEVVAWTMRDRQA
jgi:DNA repair photolyase